VKTNRQATESQRCYLLVVYRANNTVGEGEGFFPHTFLNQYISAAPLAPFLNPHLPVWSLSEDQKYCFAHRQTADQLTGADWSLGG